MKRFHTLCKINEIAEGKARVFPVEDILVSVFRVGGEFFALENGCPHAGASLARGIVQDDVVRCRIHHWGFCLRDGVYVDEDKPRYNARSFAVRIVDDEVQVSVDG